jgi:hypothetical protein
VQYAETVQAEPTHALLLHAGQQTAMAAVQGSIAVAVKEQEVAMHLSLPVQHATARHNAPRLQPA